MLLQANSNIVRLAQVPVRANMRGQAGGRVETAANQPQAKMMADAPRIWVPTGRIDTAECGAAVVAPGWWPASACAHKSWVQAHIKI